MNKNIFSVALRSALVIGILFVVVAVVRPWLFGPSKTNRDYVQELIDKQTSKDLAVRLVAEFQKNTPGLDETRLMQMRAYISTCIDTRARQYLLMADPALSQKATSETPKQLAQQFMRACNLID